MQSACRARPFRDPHASRSGRPGVRASMPEPRGSPPGCQQRLCVTVRQTLPLAPSVPRFRRYRCALAECWILAPCVAIPLRAIPGEPGLVARPCASTLLASTGAARGSVPTRSCPSGPSEAARVVAAWRLRVRTSDPLCFRAHRALTARESQSLDVSIEVSQAIAGSLRGPRRTARRTLSSRCTSSGGSVAWNCCCKRSVTAP